MSIEGSILMEEHTDTRYEISGGISGNARFYITEARTGGKRYSEKQWVQMDTVGRCMAETTQQ